jgi:type II secretory pathway component PulM
MESKKYTKEQAEMLALLLLLGCAVVVLMFLYLVKPNFARAATSRAELKKIEAEVAKLGKANIELAKAKKEMETLEATITDGEKKVFPGLESTPRLDRICVDAATRLELKTALGIPTSDSLLEFKERNQDGQQLTRHYDEVRQTLDIQSVDFLTFGRFLAAVENANEGLRVTQLELSNLSLEATDQEKGNVKAKVELSLLGMKEPGEASPEIDVTGSKLFDEGGRRNPFGPAGGMTLPITDPLKRVKSILGGLKITGMWGDVMMMEVPGGGTLEVRKNETFDLGGSKMKYLSGAADSVVFEAVDHGKRYKLTTNWSGQVNTITEEEVK